MKIPFVPFRQAAPVLLVAMAGVAMSWTAERQSTERANRLYRQGLWQEAVVIYADRLDANAEDLALQYNLGTALLPTGTAEASVSLSAAGGSTDTEVRAHSFYNLGLWHLTRALEAEAADSVLGHTLASVEASKEALRLSPGDPAARWNLAMAQRMLDSVRTDESATGSHATEGSSDAQEPTRSEEADVDEETPVGEGPKTGEQETPAASDDLGPLTPEQADGILGTGHLDAAPVMRKLLAYEGRAQRSARPGRTRSPW